MSTEQETTDKQECVKPDLQEDFTIGGKCFDEITFVFDDGQKLFVSQNFLHYVSPVFKAMFEHDYEEKTTRTVKLPGKNRDDFLEFLLCLHPGKQKPVDRENAMTIASIAEEYQSPVVVERCKRVMIDWLNEGGFYYPDGIAKAARDRLRILTLAASLHYNEIECSAITTLGSIAYQYFTGMPYVYSRKQKKNENTENFLSESKTLFDSLDVELKCRILLARLQMCDRESEYHA